MQSGSFVLQRQDGTISKEALEGLKGVKRVEKGFRYLQEINTVYYDPAVITIQEMEMALKKAGTYSGTVK